MDHKKLQQSVDAGLIIAPSGISHLVGIIDSEDFNPLMKTMAAQQLAQEYGLEEKQINKLRVITD